MLYIRSCYSYWLKYHKRHPADNIFTRCVLPRNKSKRDGVCFLNIKAWLLAVPVEEPCMCSCICHTLHFPTGDTLPAVLDSTVCLGVYVFYLICYTKFVYKLL